MKVWKLDINPVLSVGLDPEEVVIGHHGRYIAHKHHGDYMLRAVYEHKDLPVAITVYFPSTKRYFTGSGRTKVEGNGWWWKNEGGGGEWWRVGS